MAASTRKPKGDARPAFERSLLLPRWLAHQFGRSGVGGDGKLLEWIKQAGPGGVPGDSDRLRAVLALGGLRIAPEVLAKAERDFMADWRRMADARQAVTREPWALTHFQWLAALFVELYLVRLADSRAALATELEQFRAEHLPHLPPVQPAQLNRLALWMATGSGKTLMLHLNALQFQRHSPRILGARLQRILLLTPSETLSRQHEAELSLSGLDALSLGVSLEVRDLHKFYLPTGTRKAGKSGKSLSLSTDAFAGPNLLLTDEGHKGAASGDKDSTNWRARRDALRGAHPEYAVEGGAGFEIEYSATFAQVAHQEADAYDDYTSCTAFDYGYRRFHDDGFGKSPRRLVTEDKDDAARDSLLTAAMVAFWRQVRYVDADAVRAARYRLAPPLAVFVGATVTGANEDVVAVIEFLARFAGDAAFALRELAVVLDAAGPLQKALWGAQLDLDSERQMGAAALHQAICTSLFGGAGALALRVVSRDELGIRLPGAQADRWCGTAYVGDARKLADKLKARGCTVETEDAVTGSLFQRLDTMPQLRFLIGSRMFIEGWSSFRVCTLGLLRIGSGAGTQVVQLFGRGVRLAGAGGRLQRSRFVPDLGPHPLDIDTAESLYVFGVRAAYVNTWLEAMQREGMPIGQREVVPVTVDHGLLALGLKLPLTDPLEEARFAEQPVPFRLADAGVVQLDWTSALVFADGIDRPQVLSSDPQTLNVARLLANPGLARLAAEDLMQRAWRWGRQADAAQLWVTPADALAWLDKVVLVADRSRLPLQRTEMTALREQTLQLWEAALARVLRRARQRFTTLYPLPATLALAHANFPLQADGAGKPVHGYLVEARLAGEVAQAVEAAIRQSVPREMMTAQLLTRVLDTVAQETGDVNLKSILGPAIAAIEAGASADDLLPPLPRLHAPQHLYRPLLVASEAKVDMVSGQLSLLDAAPSAMRISPPPLVESEARFIWDLRRRWEVLHTQPAWQSCEVAVLRNLVGVGVGLFAQDGFYPDFLLWLARGPHQVMAFVEPKGLRLAWPQDKIHLLTDIVPQWKFSIPVRGFMVSSNTDEDLARLPGGFSWSAAPACLLRQDEEAHYIDNMLGKLVPLLGSPGAVPIGP